MATISYKDNKSLGTSLVVQWLRIRTLSAKGLGSIPGQGTRPHMLQLKILCSTTKTWSSQINKNKLKKKDIKAQLPRPEAEHLLGQFILQSSPVEQLRLNLI